MDAKKNSKLQNARLAAGLATLLKLCLALDCKLGDILTDEETVKLLEQYTAA